jgi:hypothetical protein
MHIETTLCRFVADSDRLCVGFRLRVVDSQGVTGINTTLGDEVRLFEFNGNVSGLSRRYVLYNDIGGVLAVLNTQL